MHMPEVFWYLSSPITQGARIRDRSALAQTKKFLKKEEEEEEKKKKKKKKKKNRTLL